MMSVCADSVWKVLTHSDRVWGMEVVAVESYHTSAGRAESCHISIICC